MNKSLVPLMAAICVTFCLHSPKAFAEDTPPQTVFGKLDNMVLSTGLGRVRLMDPSGKITWSCKAKNVHDCWMLESGNVLFADGCVTEIDPKTDEIVWKYTPDNTRDGAFACQRLENETTLVGENSTGRILEIDKSGKIVFQLKVEPFRENNHHNLRMVRKLKSGNYLVCHSGAKLVREYTPQGKIIFEVEVDSLAFSAVRLESGNTLVGHIGHLTEFTPEGKAVWQFSNEDIDGVVISMMCDVHVLPCGNIAVGIYSAYKDGEGNGMFEITRKKKLVWRYSNPGVDRNMMGVQVLNPQGKPLSDFPLR